MVKDLFVKEIVVDAISSENNDVIVLNTMFVILSFEMIFVAVSTLVRGIESELLLFRSVKLAQYLVRS